MEKRRLMHSLEEFILILIILLNVLDFFELLPADIDYMKKVLSFTALGYILYKASLTRIFFNSQNRIVDFLLVLSYFMLIFKNVVIFSSGLIDEFIIFQEFQKFILDNAPGLELFFLVVGSIMILLLAFYSSFFIDVKKPSLMHIIHEEGKLDSFSKSLVRIISVYMVFLTFFLVVFNLVIEWFAIAVDSTVVMIAMLFYIYVVVRHYRKFSAETLIYRIGEFGDKFYESFITLFHYKKSIFLGISGMLVLHLFTDALSYIVPYVFVFQDALYFGQLGDGHTPLIFLFFEQIKPEPIITQISLFFVYLLNAVGVLFLLLIPFVLWYAHFANKKFIVNRAFFGLFFSSAFVFFAAPVFKISRLMDMGILGVDIKTKLAEKLIIDSFFYVIMAAFAIFISASIFSKYYKKVLVYLITFGGLVFFTYYIYLFSTSLLFYYVDVIRALFASSRLLFSLYFLIFLTINVLFYVGGFIIFVDEVIKEKVYKRFL